ncbi:MAG: response regulator [Alphaproteobacteria bacterium]|nr:response regulator [Alphaproteobacteria bacterium]
MSVFAQYFSHLLPHKKKAYLRQQTQLVPSQPVTAQSIAQRGADDLIFSSAPIAVCLTDDFGTIIRMNRKFHKIFKPLVYNQKEKKKWFQFFEIDQSMMTQNYDMAYDDASLDEEKTQEEIDLIFYEGEILDLNKILQPLLTGQHDVIEIAVRCKENECTYNISFFRIIYSKDIKKLKNIPTVAAMFQDNSMEHQLRRKLSNMATRDAIGQLVGGIAHDFNNMISMTKGSIEALLEVIPPRANGYADLQRIQQSCVHASQFIKQITGLSRDIKTECYPINFSHVLEAIEPLLLRLFPRDMLIDVYHDAANTDIMANELQVEQIIVNIAINARDAMQTLPDKKHFFSIHTSNVTLSEKIRMPHGQIVAGDYLRVMMGDSGPGVSPDIIDRIFEPFFTTKDVGKGTGLGLGMVNSIIQQMGGGITLDNNEKGGATFSLYFSMAKKQEANVMTSSNQQLLKEKNKIILADDEPAVRYFTAKLLRKYGYEVIEVEDGLSAMKIAKAEMPDLLVTDMRMPRMDGAQLITEIKKLNPNLPIICISGFVRDETFSKIAQLQYVAFISKPYSADQFKKMLEELLYQAYIIDD